MTLPSLYPLLVQMVVIVMWSMGGFYVICFFPMYTFEAVLKLAAAKLHFVIVFMQRDSLSLYPLLDAESDGCCE